MSTPLKVTRRTEFSAGGRCCRPCSPLLSAFGIKGPRRTEMRQVTKIEKDVVVGKGGDADLLCDIYRPPPGTEKRMALVHSGYGVEALLGAWAGA